MGHLYKTGAMLMAGCLIVTNPILGILGVGLSTLSVASLSVGTILAGWLFDRLSEESEYEKLFRVCGLENKDKKIPYVINKTRKDNELSLVVHMPEGISQKHFEQKQQEIEQYLNARIEFSFNKNLIIKVTEMNLSTMYEFEKLFSESKEPLEIYCGETHSGKFILDITKCPHIIASGETDSGKSSLLDIFCIAIILNKHPIDLHLIDFQAVTLGKYEDCKKVKSYGETPADLDRLLDEMEEVNKERLALFRSVKKQIFIDKLSLWNKHFPERALPHKVVIIDEFARLAQKDCEDILEKFRTRVSMDRKVGIHYIASLQRPDVKVIEGAIKANMPCRIAFRTATEIDSRVILDKDGAEQIKNQGRFIIKYKGEYKEVQGLYIEPDKIWELLRKSGKLKTPQDAKADRKEQIKRLKKKCINPYLKGEGNDTK